MIISVHLLHEKLKQKEDIVILDVRSDLKDETIGIKIYKENHIPGASHLDLKRDLASPAKEHGGENPLPDPNKLAKTLGNLGIDHQTEVVIYDNDNGMYASRAWWVLYYIGLDNISILDGGYVKWVEAGFTTTEKIPVRDAKQLQPKVRNDLFVDIEEVKEKVIKKEAILIDSRAPERYRGEVEPLYAKAGHIPGAINFPYQNVYRDDGTWKSEPELQEVFASLPKTKEIIVSCGSGVSACSNVFGLKRSGFTNVKLYPGSYSDWISYEENEVVKGDE